jgi:hypothetical protein
MVVALRSQAFILGGYVAYSRLDSGRTTIGTAFFLSGYFNLWCELARCGCVFLRKQAGYCTATRTRTYEVWGLFLISFSLQRVVLVGIVS